MEGHFYHAGTGAVLLLAALAVNSHEGHLAFGGMIACCPDRCETEHMHIEVSIREAGRLIASLYEHADRKGVSASLTAAIDQGRAWARSAPR